jgi:4'-phosphopantetheinyl transferase EntD
MEDSSVSQWLDKASVEMVEHSPFIKNVELIEFNGYQELLALSGDFDVTHFENRLFDDFSCKLPSELLTSVSRRKAEYLAGRVMAMKALDLLGSNESQVYIGKHRAPVWPSGYLGSITHTSKKAIAVVARKISYKYIGIDCEEIFDKDVVDEVKSIIVNPAEVALLSSLDASLTELLTLVFSAKESFFKAFYPYVLDYFDFDAVEIIGISLEKQTFTLMIFKDLTPDIQKGMQFDGIFSFNGSVFLTAIFH